MNHLSSTGGQVADQDWICIQKIREGEKSAFEALFDRHKNRAVNLAFRFTKSREAAEDIAHDVFLKIYEGKFHFEPKAKFSTWLYRVIVNASIDFTRQKKFIPIPEQVADIHSPKILEVLKQAEMKFSVQSAIDSLPEKFRSPILLYQFENMSYREIAGILGISEKAVERRLYHAKERLREALSRYL